MIGTEKCAGLSVPTNAHDHATSPLSSAGTPREAVPEPTHGVESSGSPADDPPCRESRGLSERCLEKACIFPATPGSRGVCLYHAREQREPVCFRSQQPSLLLLEWAKFGVAGSEFEDTRARDRRRFAALRAAFLESV